MNSLRSRMVWNYGVLIMLVVVMLGSMFVTLVWNYYYGSAQGALLQRAQTEAALHNRNIASRPLQLKAEYMLQNMTEGSIHLQLLDYSGLVVVESNGLSGAVGALGTPDVKQAMNVETGSWRGNDETTNERIAAVTVPVMDNGRVVAMFRYSSSLERIDVTVRNMLWLTVLVGVVVVLLFFMMSVLLANRIARPIRNLTLVAEQMGEGDWSRRASLYERDEIGRLAETLNKMAAELTRREKLKNDFISSISHELRTPLTSIKGWSETLASGDLTDVDELQLGLAVIDRETERLSGLVEDLLDFSKLYAKSIVLHPETLDLLKPIKETIRQFEVRGQREGVKLIGHLSDMPLMVQADANRLKQVFINVLDNALKFTPAGGEITIVAAADSPDWARISIADTGCGIQPEDLPHITEKFYKGSSQRTGSGLGLAICKEIVELHGGTLRMDSVVDAGTVVTLTVPLVQQPPLPGKQESAT